MLGFIFKRVFYGSLVLIGVVTIVFLLFNVLPGDPARMMMGQRADQESIDIIRQDLGLNRPLHTQFLFYLNDLSPLSIHDTKNKKSLIYLNREKYPEAVKLFSVGENRTLVLKTPYLRRSYQTKRPVSEIISDTLPETAVLAFASIAFATVIGIVVGVFTAMKKNSLFDKSSLFVAVLGMSGPSFFIGLIIAWVFGNLLSDLTGLNMVGSLYTMDDLGDGEYLDLKNLILPAFTLGIRPLAIVIQLTRSSMLDVMTQDYIRTARAKGLGRFSVIFKHALKNALNPVVTAISGWFASLMAGAVFVEGVFAWKGIGYEVIKALEKMDMPVVMGVVLMIAIFFVIINILVDIIYGVLDPRVRMT